MSYTVLARKYRSADFDELVGQNHVAQTLKKAIDSGRIAHAFLFCGTRGTGKTSTARILAKALNCRKSKGPTAEPCNKCDSCQAIARGEDMDVIEIDAASNTGVDNIREVIENSQYRPAKSRFKIYIVDEVHMLSKSAFNALLKTLEEPPEHVKFILATTEPEKVLPTILSRCQRYDFRTISTREIAEHLKKICKEEKIKADDDALLMIAKAGAGSMRDSLSLLDRLLSIGEKQLTMESVEQLLGMPKTQLMFDLAEQIGAGNIKAVLQQTDTMLASGLSPDTLIASLIDHLRNLLILQACGPDSNIIEVPGMSLKELDTQAQRFDATVLTQDITILEELRRTLRQTQAGRALLDATLVRLALADQFASVGELLDRVNNGAPATGSPNRAATPAQKKKPEVGVALKSTAPLTPSAGTPGEGRGEEKSSVAQSFPISTDTFDDDLPRPGKVWEGDSGPSLSTLLAQHSAKAAVAQAPVAVEESNVQPVDPTDTDGIWKAVVTLLSTRGPALSALLMPATFAGITDGQAVLRYGASNATFVKMLEKNGKKDILRDAFTQLLNKPIGIRFEIDETEVIQKSLPAETPPPAKQSRFEEQPEPAAATPAIRLTPELRESLRSDPYVKAVLETFGGDIIKVE
jgi:DNA polymerase-3 subunit gamma/tau